MEPRIVSQVLLSLAVLAWSGCGGDDGAGDAEGPVDGAGVDVAQGDAGEVDSGGQQDAEVDAAPNCIPEQTPSVSPHYSGHDCMTCHGISARVFTAAGTVYTDAWGTAAVAGATVVLTASDGTDIYLVTADNGSFHTAEPLAASFPKRVTRCPYDVTADSPGNNGACNGCHTTGNRIHLP